MKKPSFYFIYALMTVALFSSCDKNFLDRKRDLLKEEVSQEESKTEESTVSNTEGWGKVINGKEMLDLIKGKPLPKGTARALESTLKDANTDGTASQKVGTAKQERSNVYETVDGVPGYWVNSTQTYCLDAAFDETILLDPSVDIIYPGCVMTGSSIADGTYAVLSNCEVGDVSFSTNLIPSNPHEIDETQKTIKNIRLSDYRKVFAKWSHMNWKDHEVKTTLAIEKVNNQQDYMLKLGATVKTKVGDFGANFGFDWKNKKTHLLGKCIQRYYSVSMDIPKTPSIFTQIDEEAIGNEQPVYVSNINYGRMIFITLSSNADEKDVEFAFKFALQNIKNPKTGADTGTAPTGELRTKWEKILNESDIRVTMIGGNKSRQTEVIQGGVEALTKFLEQDTPMEEMVPISFNLRYASDNSNARIIKQSEYTVSQKDFVQDFDKVRVRISLDKFRATDLRADWLNPLDQTMTVSGVIGYFLDLKPTEETRENGGDVFIIPKESPYTMFYRGNKGQNWHELDVASKPIAYVTFKRPKGAELDDFITEGSLCKFYAGLYFGGRFEEPFEGPMSTQSIESLYSKMKSNEPYVVLELGTKGHTRKLQVCLKIEDIKFGNSKGKETDFKLKPKSGNAPKLKK